MIDPTACRACGARLAAPDAAFCIACGADPRTGEGRRIFSPPPQADWESTGVVFLFGAFGGWSAFWGAFWSLIAILAVATVDHIDYEGAALLCGAVLGSWTLTGAALFWARSRALATGGQYRPLVLSGILGFVAAFLAFGLFILYAIRSYEPS